VDGVGIIVLATSTSTTDVVDALITRNFLVALSNGCSPRSRWPHVHPHSVDDVVVASEARLLSIRLLRDHTHVTTATSAHRTDGRPQLRQLLAELLVVFFIHCLVGECLLENLDQALFEALKVLSVEFVGEFFADLFEPHAEVGARVL